MHSSIKHTALFGGVVVFLFALSLLVQPVAHGQFEPSTIAYVRSGGTHGDQIRLIEADGSNDRALWTVPLDDPGNIFSILSLDWHPAANELAFSSNHERTCSIHDSDIYSLRADGSGFRRLSNGPACAALTGLPSGNVTVTLRNFTSKFDTLFNVYVQGAPAAQEVVIPWNGTATVTLSNVADFGAVDQLVAVMHPGDSTDQHDDYRWYVGAVDVRPGQTSTAEPNPAAAVGDGAPHPGAWGPSWRSDGTRIGFAGSDGACFNAHSVPAVNPPLGVLSEPLLTADEITPCSFAWGPTAATAEALLFVAHPNLGMDGATFYRASVGDAASSGTPLFALGSTVRLLWYDWLPDGGGFLFARTTDFNTTNFATANLFEYSFATGETTQLTHFADEFVRSFGIAPDGQTIVFERAPTLDGEESDLWLMARNGENQRLLVVNGRAPSWSNVDTVQPGATPQPTPEATPTPRPSATPRPGNSTAPAAYLPLVQR